MKALLLDLDGTLLLSDEKEFYARYFKLLGNYMKELVEPTTLIKTVERAIDSITINGGGKNNYERFFDELEKNFGDLAKRLEERFVEFYEGPFDLLREITSPNHELIDKMRKFDGLLVLATNPLFPEVAIRKRAEWAGIGWDEFSLATVMENSHYLKPQREYFLEIADKIGVKPEDCRMVGNDPVLDGASEKVGMKFTLLSSQGG